MTPGTRACVAYLAGRVVLNTASMGVHDRDRSRDHRVGGTIHGDRVALYDYERRCNLSGALPRLHDDGTDAALVLNIDGHLFEGRDCSSGLLFSGWVNDWNIHILDDAESRVFVYVLQPLGSEPAAAPAGHA